MQTKYIFLITAALLVSIPLSAQQKKKPAETAKPAAPKPKPAPATAKKTVKILPDADCIIRVDGEEQARCKASQIAKIYLPSAGIFYIEVVSIADRNVKYTRNYEVKDFKDDLLEVRLPVDSKTTSSAPSAASSGANSYTDPLAGAFIKVSGGTFTMGCTGEQTGCGSDESPAHRVTLSDFYLGETEVTQAQWRAVMGNDPSNFSGCDQCPVEQVSWDAIQDFLSKLNSRSGGARYRLPTEAEWEYAARGGNQSRSYQYAGSNNLDEVAWYYNNSGDRYLSGSWDYNQLSSNNCRTHPVKTKRANELGLYDMSGNVWEWCSDWYGDYSSGNQTNPSGPSSGSYRVLRGGSWNDDPALCRVALRDYYAPDYRYDYLGFRLARTP